MPQVFQTTQISRPVYYDRNPLPIIPLATFSGGPHADTVRASYTPAWLGAAFIEAITANAQRVTAAAPNAQAAIYVEYVPFYGGSIAIINNIFVSNTPYFPQALSLTGFGYMAYGDVLKIHTLNADTGGIISFYGAIKGTEFDY